MGEVGGIFQTPAAGETYAMFNAFVGSPSSPLAPGAIEVVYGQAFKLAPADPAYPPSIAALYAALKANAPEVFVTAGGSPVYWGPSLALDASGQPTAPQANWQQAVNVSDPAFIAGWIDYAAPLTDAGQWIELDEAIFVYADFGVLNAAGVFSPNVTWDPQFPQNAAEYLESIAEFFEHIADAATVHPIRVMPDVGSISDPTQFQSVYADCPGAMFEDLMAWLTNPAANSRNTYFAQAFQLFPWFLGTLHNGTGILRAILPPDVLPGSGANLLTAFSLYQLLKGPNSFFAPGDEAGQAASPAEWTQWATLLGAPAEDIIFGPPAAGGAGFRLYQRGYANGRVYVNWTGAPLLITLPPVMCFDPAGEAISSPMALPDGTGTFVTFSA
jgi:hypothetical protein